MTNLKLPTMTASNLETIVTRNGFKTIAYATKVERYWKNGEAGHGFFVYHHGNMIANISRDFIELSNGGWDSRTTANRLRTICNDNEMPFTVACRQDETVLYRRVHGTMDRIASFYYQPWHSFRRTVTSWEIVK